ARDVPANGCCHEGTGKVIASDPDPGARGRWAARRAAGRKDLNNIMRPPQQGHGGDDRAWCGDRLRRALQRLWAGYPDIGIEHFETSMRLNPLQGRADPYLGIGMGHFFACRFEDAAATLLLSLQEGPSWPPTYRFLASCYAHLGRLDDAQETVNLTESQNSTSC